MIKYKKELENYEKFQINYRNKFNNTSINFSTQKFSNKSFNKNKKKIISWNSIDGNNSVNNINNIQKTPNFYEVNNNIFRRKTTMANNNHIENFDNLNKKFKEIELMLNFVINKKIIITFNQLTFILNYIKLIDINSKNKTKLKHDENFVKSIYMYLIKEKNGLYYLNVKLYLTNLWMMGNKILKNKFINFIPKNSSKSNISKKSLKTNDNRKITFNNHLNKNWSLLGKRKKKIKKTKKKLKKPVKIKKLNTKKNIKIKIKKKSKSSKKKPYYDLYNKNNDFTFKNKKSLDSEFSNKDKKIINNFEENRLIPKINKNNYLSEKKNVFEFESTINHQYNYLKINFNYKKNNYLLYLPLNDKIIFVFEDFCKNNQIPFNIKIDLLDDIKKKFKF